MRLVCYLRSDRTALGVVVEGRVLETDVDPDDLFARGLEGLPELERRLAEALASRSTTWHEEGDLRLAPCVPNPGKIICVGLNYARHAAEAGLAAPSTPVLFSKFNNALAASGDEVPLARDDEECDYEAELVVVMGRRARDVSEDEALSYVLGYCNGNDVSARALQRRTGQWLLGKTLDRFMPIGPHLVTSDEVPDPDDLVVQGRLNGTLRQDSTTADLIFSVPQIIAYATRYMTLEPGDLISTGTPEGVILGRPGTPWLQPGDEFSVTVGHLGTLTNTFLRAR